VKKRKDSMDSLTRSDTGIEPGKLIPREELGSATWFTTTTASIEEPNCRSFSEVGGNGPTYLLAFVEV
jgi:hypothetical protein